MNAPQSLAQKLIARAASLARLTRSGGILAGPNRPNQALDW